MNERKRVRVVKEVPGQLVDVGLYVLALIALARQIEAESPKPAGGPDDAAPSRSAEDAA